MWAPMLSMVLPKKAREANQNLLAYYRSTCSTYSTLFPLGDGSSWVQGRLVGNQIFVMGCSVCEKAGAVTPFGRFRICTRSAISRHVLDKHQKSKTHAEARSSDNRSALGAPSSEAFRRVLDNPGVVNPDVGSKKQSVMRWCLAEAKLDMERAFVQNAHTTLLAQDAAKGGLLVRVSVSDSHLVNSRFIVGYANLEGTDSFAIKATTEKAIDRWATPRFNVPVWGTTRLPDRQPTAMNAVVKSKLCASIRGIATDAASDEFRAMRLASGASESVFIDSALFPNVVLHAKDPTHASGRFLKVWQHDPFLNGVFDLLVWGPDSMAKLIENSEDISRRFAIRVKMQESSDMDGRRIKNMKFVKPRFNSAQAPLARAILFFDALVGTAVELSAVRSGDDPARTSQLFLATMNEERLIQAAMMADAGDEAIQLTRLFDAGDSCQLASMPADLHNFVETVNYLFVRQPAGCLKSGYTAYALELLQRPRVVFVGRGPKTIGGPGKVTLPLVGRCLARMAGWARLSIQCMNYEYPDWHLLLSFSAFDLASRIRDRATHGFGDDFSDKCFQRLAAAFGGDVAELRAQHADHVAFASAHFTKHEKDGFATAWAASVKRPRGMRLDEGAIMRKSVHALQAWDGFTSSEIERGLGAIRRVIGKHRDQMDDVHQGHIAKLTMDVPTALKDDVVCGARKVWLEYWCQERESGQSRSNFTRKRKSPGSDKMTEAEFIRQRRAATRAGASAYKDEAGMSRTDVLVAASAACSSEWHAENQRAEDKLIGRQKHSKALAAIGDNVLLEDECDDETKLAAGKAKVDRAKLDKDHDAKRKRAERKVAPRVARDLQKMPTYLAVSLGGDAAACRAKLARPELECDGDRRCDAVVFVVKDIASPGYHTALVSMLLGGAVVDSTYFLTNSQKGVSITYQIRKSLFS